MSEYAIEIEHRVNDVVEIHRFKDFETYLRYLSTVKYEIQADNTEDTYAIKI